MLGARDCMRARQDLRDVAAARRRAQYLAEHGVQRADRGSFALRRALGIPCVGPLLMSCGKLLVSVPDRVREGGLLCEQQQGDANELYREPRTAYAHGRVSTYWVTRTASVRR